MKFAIISDIHIGDEQFTANRPGFVEFLDYLERTHDEIILLGDIIECYFSTWPWGAHSDWRRNIAENTDLTDRFFKPPYTLLSGNHDAIAFYKLGIPYETIREVDGMRILFTHGHSFEWMHSTRIMARLSALYMWFAYRFKKAGFAGFYNWGYSMNRKNNTDGGGSGFVNAARDLIELGNYDIVVMGHTHDAKIVSVAEGKFYVNSGDCLTRKMFASIDTLGRTQGLFRYVDGEILPM